jgi:hypothetical protein
VSGRSFYFRLVLGEFLCVIALKARSNVPICPLFDEKWKIPESGGFLELFYEKSSVVAAFLPSYQYLVLSKPEIT